MKVVLDTNILISGIGRPEGAPGQIVSAWLAGKFDLVVSEALLEEFRRVLFYPKVRKLLMQAGLADDDLRDYIDIMRMKAITASTNNVPLPVTPPDPKDTHVLEALVAADAEFLVTGDKKHLLSLGMAQIVTAADFAARLRAFGSPASTITTAGKPVSKKRKR